MRCQLGVAVPRFAPVAASISMTLAVSAEVVTQTSLPSEEIEVSRYLRREIRFHGQPHPSDSLNAMTVLYSLISHRCVPSHDMFAATSRPVSGKEAIRLPVPR